MGDLRRGGALTRLVPLIQLFDIPFFLLYTILSFLPFDFFEFEE